jgi:DNA-binding GntR family transcriptional regulator
VLNHQESTPLYIQVKRDLSQQMDPGSIIQTADQRPFELQTAFYRGDRNTLHFTRELA